MEVGSKIKDIGEDSTFFIEDDSGRDSTSVRHDEPTIIGSKVRSHITRARLQQLTNYTRDCATIGFYLFDTTFVLASQPF